VAPEQHSSLTEPLTDLFVREGYPGEKAGREVVSIVIDWVLRSGQWVMITDPAHPVLWGWSGYVLVDDKTLELIHSGGLDDFIADRVPLEFRSGPNVYITHSIVAPWAPRGTYRRLYELVVARNRDASTVSAHLLKRDGKSRWMHRQLR